MVFLEIDGNRLTGEIPSEMVGLSNLEVLDLSYNQLTGSMPSELGHLSNVVVLALNGNRLTGQIPASLVSLVKLNYLYLRNEGMTGYVPERLQDVADNDLSELGLPICAAPTTAMSTAPARVPVRISSPIPVTTWFSEPVIDFTIDDLIVVNGSASNFVGGDGDMVYTFDLSL